jgi:hypothetical protein
MRQACRRGAGSHSNAPRRGAHPSVHSFSDLVVMHTARRSRRFVPARSGHQPNEQAALRPSENAEPGLRARSDALTASPRISRPRRADVRCPNNNSPTASRAPHPDGVSPGAHEAQQRRPGRPPTPAGCPASCGPAPAQLWPASRRARWRGATGLWLPMPAAHRATRAGHEIPRYVLPGDPSSGSSASSGGFRAAPH